MTTLVAGVDSSTQSTKIVVCDAADGTVVRAGSAPHPDGTEVDPAAWWEALRAAAAGGLLDGVEALAVAGQQHGMVALDGAGQPVRPALLWNDVRSADAADELVAELGADTWATVTGSVPTASFTVTKLRWLATNEPANAARTRAVLLPHDWLTWRLAGGLDNPGGWPEMTTDRGDASGTGYWSPASGEYQPDLLKAALGEHAEHVALPRVAGPAEAVGRAAVLAPGALLAPGTGDNMAAALGVGPGPGDVIVSVGTSGTIFAVCERSTHDPQGLVAGFADATGRFLPLVCTLNAARVLGSVAGLLGVSPAEFDALALAGSPGAGGMSLLPYFDGERTPNLPRARGVLAGITRAALTRENLARAAIEGVLCGLADGMDALRRHGVEARRVLLVGGGARSTALRRLAPAILGLPVAMPDPDIQWVARGAARQAAWVLSGAPEPPDWPIATDLAAAEPDPATRAAYAAVLDDVLPLLRRPAPGR
ncbi:MAG: xylulokinase [Frankia sp.]|nr:xylulokinase [Frankia sp.]